MKRIVTLICGLLLGFSAQSQIRQQGPIVVPGDGGFYKDILLGFPSSTVNGICSDGVNLYLRANGQLLDKNGNPIAGTQVLATPNASVLTNLTYQYSTNPVVANVVIFGQANFITINADTVISSLTFGPNGVSFYESTALIVKNTDSAPHKITWPNGVMGIPGNVAPAVTWATNGVLTEIDVAHYANNYTNAAAKN
jgi:hypothetical protein